MFQKHNLGVLIVVIVDICPVSVWASAARRQRRVFIIVMLAPLVTGTVVVHPEGQIRLKSLKEVGEKGSNVKMNLRWFYTIVILATLSVLDLKKRHQSTENTSFELVFWDFTVSTRHTQINISCPLFIYLIRDHLLSEVRHFSSGVHVVTFMVFILQKWLVVCIVHLIFMELVTTFKKKLLKKL